MSKLITVSENLLQDILPHVKNTPLEKKINDLENGDIVRYVGITSPETGEPFEKEATEANRKLVEGEKSPVDSSREVTLEYDNYKGDKFGRILAYIIINGKNVSIELARLGMAQVVVYQHKKPFIYIDELLKAQEEAKKKKLGIWSQ